MNNNDIAHDFRPATPGWRVAYRDADAAAGFVLRDLAGWLVQGAHARAAIVDTHTGILHSAAEISGFWFVLAPSDRNPTPAEVRQENERRAAEAKRHAEPKTAEATR